VNDKGFDVLLEAFGRIAVSCPDWDLVVIGDGPSAHSLISIVRSKGLAERIMFVGFSNQAHLIYEACDVFIYASPQEGFGMVIAEAQASGLPAICFDCLAGPKDIVSDQETGMLIPLGDIECFAAAMGRLASDEVLRSRLALAAKGVSRKLGAAAIIPKWRTAFQRSNPPTKPGAHR
jgi:glycosyltransferase involved in cell wall biosynthesis